MPAYDLAIRGGTVVTAADTTRCDIAVKDGRIAALAASIDDAAETIDASGLLVLPGGIDSHVHIAQHSPGIRMADDFASGTRAALAGGNTTIQVSANGNGAFQTVAVLEGVSVDVNTLFNNNHLVA